MSEKKICKVCGGEFDLDFFQNHPTAKDGHSGVCKHCMSKLQSEGHKKRRDEKKMSLEEEVKNARFLRVMEFTPRELMEALKKKGFEGTLSYTEVHTINLATL